MNKQELAQIIYERLSVQDYCELSQNLCCVTLDGLFNLEDVAQDILQEIEKGKKL